jgi:hypothetical protein
VADPRRVQIKAKSTVTVGKATVTNNTADAIEVEVAPDGTVVVTNCCLKEQGIKLH